MMFFGSLLTLIGLGGIAYALGWRPNESEHRAGQGDSAIEILKRRYASGEISRDEFLQMREEISE